MGDNNNAVSDTITQIVNTIYKNSKNKSKAALMMVPRPTRLSPLGPPSYHSLQPSGLWCYELWTLSSAGPLLAQRQKQDCGWSTPGPSDLSLTQSCVVFSQLLSTFSPDWAPVPSHTEEAVVLRATCHTRC